MEVFLNASLSTSWSEVVVCSFSPAFLLPLCLWVPYFFEVFPIEVTKNPFVINGFVLVSDPLVPLLFLVSNLISGSVCSVLLDPYFLVVQCDSLVAVL